MPAIFRPMVATKVNKERMRAEQGTGFTVATDAADYLAAKVPFREYHIGSSAPSSSTVKERGSAWPI